MPATSVNLDIGNFSKRTILTGAGWTRNWGGWLASELWQDLVGHRAIQNNSRLRELLLGESSFEAALGLVRAAPFTSSDRQTFEGVLLEAFIAMDREVALIPDPWINIYKVQELLFRFCGRRGQGANAGYMFTLNQDLWPERYIWNEHVSGAPHPSLRACGCGRINGCSQRTSEIIRKISLCSRSKGRRRMANSLTNSTSSNCMARSTGAPSMRAQNWSWGRKKKVRSLRHRSSAGISRSSGKCCQPERYG